MRVETIGGIKHYWLEDDDVLDEAEHFLGQKAKDEDYKVLIEGENANVYKPNGEPLAILRRGVIPPKLVKQAYNNINDAAASSANRGMAAGVIEEDEIDALAGRTGEVRGTRHYRLLANGELSKTSEAKRVDSGIVGFFGRTPRFPYCRTTAYNLKNPEKFAAAVPMFQCISQVFKEELPDRWQAQKDAIDRVHEDFFIPNTVYTTVTVNKNFRTAYHRDKGDYHEGFGCMSAVCLGEWDGSFLVFPKFQVAVSFRTCDVILADVHEIHGNTAVQHYGRPYVRLSVVLYMREDMLGCKSAEEELEIVRQRKLGQPMWEDEHED